MTYRSHHNRFFGPCAVGIAVVLAMIMVAGVGPAWAQQKPGKPASGPSAAAKKANRKTRTSEAIELLKTGLRQFREHRYAQSEAAHRQALPIFRELYPVVDYPNGQFHLWRTQVNLGVLRVIVKHGNASIKHLEEMLAATRKKFPPEKFPAGHQDIGLVLKHLGLLHLYGTEDKDASMKYMEESYRMHKLLYPKEKYPTTHPRVAFALDNYREAVNHRAIKADTEGNALLAQNRLYDAAKQFEFAATTILKYPESAGGRRDASIYRGRMANAYRMAGDLDLARSVMELVIKEQLAYYEAFPRMFPEDYRAIGDNWLNLGETCKSLRSYEEAEEHFLLAMQQYDLAVEHAKNLRRNRQQIEGYRMVRAVHLRRLVGLYRDTGEFSKARTLIESFIATAREIYPAEKYPDGHQNLAVLLDDYSILLSAQGETKLAYRYAKESADMNRRLYPKSKFPKGHIETANVSTRLAKRHGELGQHQRAIEVGEETVAMWRGLLEDKSPDEARVHFTTFAATVSDLAFAYGRSGDYERFLQLQQEARGIFTRTYPRGRYPNGHMELAHSQANLAMAWFSLGKNAEATKHLRASQAMKEKLLAGVDTLAARANLAYDPAASGMVAFSEQDHATASAQLGKSVSIYQEVLAAQAATLSEAEALSYLHKSRVVLDILISVAAQDVQFSDEVYQRVWRRRGLVQRVVEERRRLAAQFATEDNKRSYTRLLRGRHALGRLAYATATSVAGSHDQAQRRRRMEELSREVELLERELAKQLKVGGSREAGWPEFSQTLPPNVAFIDFIRFKRQAYDPRTPGLRGRSNTLSYVAFVLEKGAGVRLVRLGPAAPIDAAVTGWREDIATRQSGVHADKLRQLVWLPLRKTISTHVDKLNICPDGSLTALPWAALPGDRTGSVLLEDYSIALAPHGHFLHRCWNQPQRELGPEDSLLLVGAVDYDQGVAEPRRDGPLVASRLRAPAVGTRKLFWPALPATKQEIDDIAELAKSTGVVQLSGAQASTANVVAKLEHCRSAHFATHGFFADKKFRSGFRVEQEDGGELLQRVASPILRHPSLFSGLVLAGANREAETDNLGIPQGDRGILTAESISGLSLDGMQLVVLSACETGLGEVADGEGVMGLQRAFHTAGARNVVGSLWKVDDQAAAALMRLFYYKLWQEKKSPIDALRDAKLAIYRHPNQIGALAGTRGPVFSKTVQLVDGGRRKQVTPSDVNNTRLWAAFVISGVAQPSQASDGQVARRWTDATGKFSVDATLVDRKDGLVVLRRTDGNEITVPFERLSETDQKYLKTIRRNHAAEPR